MAKLNRRTFLKWAGFTTLGVGVAGGGTGIYSWKLEPGWLEVTAVTVPLARLDPAFEGYRIAQLSDIHADDSWMDKGRLETIVAGVNDLKPDLIVITGDFVTRLRDSVRDTLSALRDLKARDGVFSVLGNHDHWSDPAIIRSYIDTYAIQELKDSTHTIRRDGAELHLIGMDDLWPTGGVAQPAWAHKDRLTALLEQVPEEGATVLLVHEPDFADVAAASKRIDLQLSGHSHGGQVRIPFYGSPIVPPLGRKYIAGLYTIDAMSHYTHRGLGMVSPQVRFNCRPEIALFTCTTKTRE